MKKVKQRNTRARAKRKLKLLKLKTLCYRIIDAKEKRIAKLAEPKGMTVKGESSKKYAMPYSALFPNGGGGWVFDHDHGRTLNQRQKRKRARAANRPVR